jgi:uncharacterized protein YcbK (DUF882 family)
VNPETLKVGFAGALFFIVLGALYYAVIRYQGMNVTSWWRSPWHNREVGGVANSLHMIGLAWDIAPASPENYRRLRAMGLKVIDEGDHLHAQLM